MKNAIIEEIVGNWEVMAAMEDAAHLARRATFRECADLLRSMAASDKSGEHEQQLEELVRSACAIADRRGAETAWDRFTASAKSLGLNGVTARTYRILPSDEPAQEAEQAATAAVTDGSDPSKEWSMRMLAKEQDFDGNIEAGCPPAAPAVTDATGDLTHGWTDWPDGTGIGGYYWTKEDKGSPIVLVHISNAKEGHALQVWSCPGIDRFYFDFKGTRLFKGVAAPAVTDAARSSPEIPDSSISAQAARDVLADAKGGFDHAAE